MSPTARSGKFALANMCLPVKENHNNFQNVFQIVFALRFAAWFKDM